MGRTARRRVHAPASTLRLTPAGHSPASPDNDLTPTASVSLPANNAPDPANRPHADKQVTPRGQNALHSHPNSSPAVPDPPIRLISLTRDKPGLKAVIGPISLERDLAMAIDDLAGGLPAAPPLRGDEADWDAAGGDWSGERLPPEEVTEKLMADKHRIARKLGFVGEIRAQKTLANGKRPDLWCEAGVVGDVKNQVTADWGPGQLEGYIKQCDPEYPEHQWRGVLVQGLPEMAPSALPRLEKSPYRDRIEVWTVTRKRRLSPVQARRLFPSD